MGYLIKIGEYNTAIEDGEEHPCIPDVALPDAPYYAVDYITGRTNVRQPSYTGRYNFCKEVHLENLFYRQPGGLFKPHPGIASVTCDHLTIIQNALDQYRRIYPNHHQEDGTGVGYNIIRLEWLVWWMSWAIQNCQRPVISNA